MAQARSHIFLPPFLVGGGLFLFNTLELFCVIDQPIRRVRPAIEQHVLHVLEQFLIDLLVHLQHAGIHDAHVQTGVYRVVQKRRMHRFAHDIVAPEGKRYVAHAAACARAGTTLFHLPHSLYEVHRILIMLLHASGDGEDVEVKNDVFRWEIQLLGEQPISTLGNGHLVINSCRLALFIKSHHNRCRTVTATQAGLT